MLKKEIALFLAGCLVASLNVGATSASKNVLLLCIDFSGLID